MKNTLSAIAMIAWSGYALAGDYTVAQLGLLNGGTYTIASAINNVGQVVGTADDYFASIFTQEVSVTLWNGTMPTLIQHSGGIFGVGANGINDSGIIVGYVAASAHLYASVWNAPGGGLGDFGVASRINDSGQIVGMSGPAPCSCFATLWASPTATIATFLPTLGGHSTSAALPPV